MTNNSATNHTVPPALITHCTAIIRGHHDADITAHHARSGDARLTMTWGGVLLTVYSAAAAHGLLDGFVAARAAAAHLPREIPPPAPVYEAPFARPMVALEFTRRPAYAVVAHSGPPRPATGSSTGSMCTWARSPGRSAMWPGCAAPPSCCTAPT